MFLLSISYSITSQPCLQTQLARESALLSTLSKMNAVDEQEKSILTLKMIGHNQCYLPFIKIPHSSLFPITGIMTLAITTL